jgi:hypothetical protein
MGTVQCQRFTGSPTFLAQRVTPDAEGACLRGLNPFATALTREPILPHRRAMWSYMVGNHTHPACKMHPLIEHCWQLYGKQALVTAESPEPTAESTANPSSWMASRDPGTDTDDYDRGYQTYLPREHMTIASNASVCVALFVVRNQDTDQCEMCTSSRGTGTRPTRPAVALGGRQPTDRATQEHG